MTNEEQQLLGRASAEIKQLKNSNQIMAIRLAAFDDILSVFKARPVEPMMGYSPAVEFDIDRYLEKQSKINNKPTGSEA